MERFYSSYLPLRIYGGTLKPEGFEIRLREKQIFLPWEKIRLICLGVLEEPKLEFHPNAYMQAKSVLRKMGRNPVLGVILMNPFALKREKEPPKESRESRSRQNYYLEFFTADHPQPFRIDAGNVNYRTLLGKVEYSSESNLRSLLAKLSEHLPPTVFDPSSQAFLAKQKEKVEKFSNVYDYQYSCLQKLKNKTVFPDTNGPPSRLRHDA